MSCGMEYPSGQFRSALKQNKNVTVVLIGFSEAGWDKIDTFPKTHFYYASVFTESSSHFFLIKVHTKRMTSLRTNVMEKRYCSIRLSTEVD